MTSLPSQLCHFDFESKSYSDLTKVGQLVYSQDPTTDVICACWGIGDDGEIQEWWPDKNETTAMPEDLEDHLYRGGHIEAHFVAFERCMWWASMHKRYGWVMPADDAWRCSMSVAAYYSMPAPLDKLALALGFGRKDPEGARLITKYSKLYLKTAKTEIPDEDFFKFVDYCKWDVELERRCSHFLGDLPDDELRIWQQDQRINARGLYLDEEGILAAARVVDEISERLSGEFRDIVGLNHTQRDKVLAWCAENGVKLENYQAGTLEEIIEGDLPQGHVRDAIALRLQINKASTKKLDSMLRQRSTNGRACYQTRYHGAVTGRSTATGFQPYNLKRGFADLDPEQLVRDIRYESATWLKLLYGDPITAVANATRHWIMAEPGNEILSGDFVSVEAVVLSCLAGEQWKIDAFRNKDPLYELMACKIHNLGDEAVALAKADKRAFKAMFTDERHDGKTCLGASTQVLTCSGWKSILRVSSEDLLWDGVLWVKHDGLVHQGQRGTIVLEGVRITPDHKILIGEAWVEAATVHGNDAMIRLASVSALENLPLSALSSGHRQEYLGSGFAAPAARGDTLCRSILYAAGKVRVALNALAVRLLSGVKITLGTPISAQMTPIGGGYATGYQLALPAVSLGATKTTEPGEYVSGPSGGMGRKVAGNISHIWLRSTAGIARNWRSTVSKLIRVMSQVIFGSQSGVKAQNDKYQNCNRELTNLRPVYDLVNAGPNRRFTIMTNAGPMIVHNCELAFGFQGALGAWLKFDSSGRHSDERIIEICKLWRADHPMITKLWRELDTASINAVLHPGVEYEYRGITFKTIDNWLSMRGLNGKLIWYWDPQVRPTMPIWHRPADKEECADGSCRCEPVPQLTYKSWKNKQFKRVSTYGGKLTENITQKEAREILKGALRRVEQYGYNPIFDVYDEIVTEEPIGWKKLTEFKEIMVDIPNGAVYSDWPISVDAWKGTRYRK